MHAPRIPAIACCVSAYPGYGYAVPLWVSVPVRAPGDEAAATIEVPGQIFYPRSRVPGYGYPGTRGYPGYRVPGCPGTRVGIPNNKKKLASTCQCSWYKVQTHTPRRATLAVLASRARGDSGDQFPGV
eukprot:96464-Rhodomonas_salina.1